MFKIIWGSFFAFVLNWPVTWKRLVVGCNGVKCRNRRILVTQLWGAFGLVGFKIILATSGEPVPKWSVIWKRLVVQWNGLKYVIEEHLYNIYGDLCVSSVILLHSLFNQAHFGRQMSKCHLTYIASSYMAVRHKRDLFLSGKWSSRTSTPQASRLEANYRMIPKWHWNIQSLFRPFPLTSRCTSPLTNVCWLL